MTGYGYKARDIDKSVIDWADVTKKISDDLISEKNKRDELKQELEKKQLEQLQKIEDYPQGLDADANIFAQKQAQQAKKLLLQQHKLMKSGLMSVNDTKLFKTRVMNTWDNLSKGLNSYNENFKRISESEGKLNEALLMEMGDFADIEKRGIYYDSEGNGFFADVDPETGEMDTSSIRPVKALNNVQAQVMDYVDVNDRTNILSDQPAVWEKAISSTRSVESARLNPAYQNWLENTTQSELNSDTKIASVLMDYLGLDYDKDGSKGSKTITYEKVVGYDTVRGVAKTETVTKDIGHVRMVYKDGRLVPELTDDQKEVAREAFKNAVEAKLITKTTKRYVAPQRPTKGETDAINNSRLIDRFVLGGDVAALNSYIRNIDGVTGSELRGDTLVIKTKTGEQEINLAQSSKKTGEELAGLTGIGNQYLNNTKSDDKTLTRITREGDYKIFETQTKLTPGQRTGLASAIRISTDTTGNVYQEETNIPLKVQIEDILNSLNKPLDSYSIDDNGVLTINGEELGNVTDPNSTVTPTKIENAILGGGQRTIKQIMEEDGVSRAEAIKIFNKQ
jgi:hypothetical protein